MHVVFGAHHICYNVIKHFTFTFRWKKQFKQLLEDTGYVTPGKALSEVRVLFMGRECFEALSEMDCQHIYDQHQKEIIEKAKHNFQVSHIRSSLVSEQLFPVDILQARY
jgi:hypothetical protein